MVLSRTVSQYWQGFRLNNNLYGQYIKIFIIALCEGTSKILSLPNNDSALSQPPSIMQSQMSLIPNTGKLKEFASLFWPFAAKKYPPN